MLVNPHQLGSYKFNIMLIFEDYRIKDNLKIVTVCCPPNSLPIMSVELL